MRININLSCKQIQGSLFKMDKYFWVIILLMFYGCSTSNKLIQQDEKEKENMYWGTDEKHISKRCKKLILRNICDYCLGKNSYYKPVRFSKTTSCLCYNDAVSIPKINEFIFNHRNEIKEIIIENPSFIIFNLNFHNLKELKTLKIFGNDYNCDALNTFPKEILSLPSMRYIVFDGVRFPKNELEKIKKEFSKIKFVGKISGLEQEEDD